MNQQQNIKKMVIDSKSRDNAAYRSGSDLFDTMVDGMNGKVQEYFHFNELLCFGIIIQTCFEWMMVMVVLLLVESERMEGHVSMPSDRRRTAMTCHRSSIERE
jgi:hypothetical protein